MFEYRQAESALGAAAFFFDALSSALPFPLVQVEGLCRVGCVREEEEAVYDHGNCQEEVEVE